MLTYVLAVLAACANATSSVLQRKANRQVPKQDNLSLRQIGRLLHEPVWFGGILAIIVGFLLQATALGTGKLSVVEPILVLELPATLLASRVFGSSMHWREWGAAGWLVHRAGGHQRLHHCVRRGRPPDPLCWRTSLASQSKMGNQAGVAATANPRPGRADSTAGRSMRAGASSGRRRG